MYTVPIIAPDLRHEETIIQAARALDCLKMTIDSVFERLDARITTNSTRVKEIGERISKAEERISGLSGVKKAIQIYAPARFPATNVLRDLPLTFNMTTLDGEQQQTKPSAAHQKSQYPQQNVPYDVVSRVESPQGQEVMQNKLVFFHVRSNASSEDSTNMGTVTPDYIAASRARVNRCGNSLGRAPEHLRSTAALLRFNSEEYAYSSCAAAEQSAQAKETWRRAKLYKNQRQSGALQRKQQQFLEPAPHSLANRHQARATPSGELRYTPQMHEAPSIDLPLDLPTLEGVAVDIHFMDSTDMHSQITPSSAMATNEPPNQLKVENEPEETIVKSSLTVMKEEPAPAAPIQTPSVPPPVKSKSTVPPPPPPPPPLAAAAITQSASSQLRSSAGSETRSALMDAIRKAGGAHGGGLRSAAAAPVDVVDTDKKHDNNSVSKSTARNAGASGGDLMADLHNKLLMRRKGISGINSKTNISTSNVSLEENPPVKRREMFTGNPVIQRLSALIPPPPPKTKVEEQLQQQRKHQQHSDDDEDNEDWD